MKMTLRATLVALTLVGAGLAPVAGLAAGGDGPSVAVRERAQRDYDKAVRLVRSNKPRDALELFERALPGKNTTSDIFFNLAQVSEALKRWDKVLAYTQGFLALESQTSDARAIRGKLDIAEKRLNSGDAAPVRYRFEAPEGSEVYVDDVPVAIDGPGEVLLVPGRHVATARKPDHKPWEQALTVKKDEPQTVAVALEAILYTGTLKITTLPAEGVSVFLDDKLAGTTPLAPITLPTVRVLVRLEKPGFDSWVRYVTPMRDQVEDVKATLERSPPTGPPQ